MPVNVIDTLKPKNGLNFPVVEAIDVFVEDYENLADAISHFATDVMIEAINTVLSGKADAADLTTLEAEVDTKADSSALATAAANLQAQIDNLITPVTEDAEVQNARVGADGTSYNTLKSRLDTESSKTSNNVRELLSDVGHNNLHFIVPQGSHSSKSDRILFPCKRGETIDILVSSALQTGGAQVFVYAANESQGTAAGSVTFNRPSSLSIPIECTEIGLYFSAAADNTDINIDVAKKSSLPNIETAMSVENLVTSLVSGYVTDTGSIRAETENHEKTSDYIEVKDETQFTLTCWATLSDEQTPWIAIAQYNDQKEFIRRDAGTTFIQEDGKTRCSMSVWIRSNAKYIRASARMYSDGTMHLNSGALSPKRFLDSAHLSMQTMLSPLLVGYNNSTYKGEVKIDDANHKIIIPKDTIAFHSKYGVFTPQRISPNEDVEITLDYTVSTALAVLYDVDTQQFSVVRWDAMFAFNSNQLLIGVFRVSGSKIFPTLNAPYQRIAEDQYDAELFNTYCRIICGQTNTYPVINTTNKTITIYNDTLIVDRRLPRGWLSLNESTISWETVNSTAIELVYDLQDSALAWMRFDSQVSPKRYIVLCSFRTNSKTIVSPCPIYIDGKLFGVINEQQATSNSFVKGINHRGYYSAPENTLPAYKLSKTKGFDTVETDVEWTSDNVPVLLHDSTIDRTSDGTGEISSMTFEQVRQYDFGSWKSDAYAGTKIPSFEEFIRLCRNLGLKAYVELKGYQTVDKVAILANIVKKYHMEENISWISFGSATLDNVKTILPEARLGVVCEGVTQNVVDAALGLKNATNNIFIDTSSITDEMVQICIQNNLEVEMWTINNQSTMLNANSYVSGFTSDSLNAKEVFSNVDNN